MTMTGRRWEVEGNLTMAIGEPAMENADDDARLGWFSKALKEGAKL